MKFSHAIFENAFDPGLCRAAEYRWPMPGWGGWNAVYGSGHQRKLACNDWLQMPEPCRMLLRQMMGLDLGALVGKPGLIPDMSLWGGGMHSLERDGILGLHLDADHHLISGLPRVLNGILFLNSDWKQEWGGNLEIWDAEKTQPTVQIAPVFNRLVLFGTGDETWHGVPQSLVCPEDVQRKTLAVWWYGADELHKGKRPRAQFAGK